MYFCKGYHCGEKVDLSKKKNVGNHAFFRDNQSTVILKSVKIQSMYGNFFSNLRRFPLNIRAVSAKIKLPKKYLQHCHILRTDKKNLSLLSLPSWPRERKLDLKLSVFQLKRRFMSVQNKMAPVFSILLRDLRSIFLRMLENFIAGSLGNFWKMHGYPQFSFGFW